MLPVQIPDWKKNFCRFFNLVLPQTCPICQSFVTGTGLCLDCWHDLRPIAKPCCAACGRPLWPHAGQFICALPDKAFYSFTALRRADAASWQIY